MRWSLFALVLAAAAPVAASLPVDAAQAQELPSAKEILERIDRNMTFDSRTMTITMTSVNPRRTREFTMKAFARGEDQAAMEYLAPAREAGTKMLRMGDELWTWMPAIEKTQKISGHMLRQGMMGTDVSYEDIMSATDLASAYAGTVSGVEPCGDGGQCYKVEMVANDPTVTYPKRITWVDTEKYIVARQELYAVSGKLLKTWTMSEPQQFEGGRWFPTRMEVSDQLQEGTKTTLVLRDIVFGVELPEEVFTQRWLERGN